MAELGRTFLAQALRRVAVGNEGSRLIGAGLTGVAGNTVQAVLEGLKTLVDTKAASDDVANALSAGLATKSDTGHIHDSRYYTETETDNLLSGKSATGHAHDDRYYTETETDTKLATKSDSGHLHTGVYSAAGHTHDDRYYTETETDTKLSAKSDSGHLHTGVYSPTGHTHSSTVFVPFAFAGEATPRVSNPCVIHGARTIQRVSVTSETAPGTTQLSYEVRVSGVAVSGGALTLAAGQTDATSAPLGVEVADLAKMTVAIVNGGAVPAQKVTVSVELSRQVS